MTLRTITFDDSIYKLVPREPTEEMLSSAWEYHGSSRYSERVLQDAVTDAECYKAMIAAAPEYQPIDLSNFDPEENWQNIDGAVAYHLIDRHADNWSDIGRMMDAWLKANQDTKKDE